MTTSRTKLGVSAVAFVVIISAFLGSPLQALAEFWSSNGSLIYNNNSGYVGIGTSNPLQNFVVTSGTNAGFEISVGSGIVVQSFNRNTAAYSTLSFDGAMIKFRPDGVTAMSIVSGGKVGIGTTSPTELLQVSGLSGAMAVSDTGTPGNQLLLQANSVNGPLIASHTNSLGQSTIAAAGAEWIISAYGHVFQTSPSTAVGTQRVWTDRMIIQGGSGTPGDLGLGGTITNRTTLAGSSMVIKGGNVGIGTTTPAAKLDVSGDLKLSGNITSDGDICIGTCQ